VLNISCPASFLSLLGTGLTGQAELAAVSGWSAAGPVRPVPDILMVAGAYCVGHLGCTDLFIRDVMSLIRRIGITQLKI